MGKRVVVSLSPRVYGLLKILSKHYHRKPGTFAKLLLCAVLSEMLDAILSDTPLPGLRDLYREAETLERKLRDLRNLTSKTRTGHHKTRKADDKLDHQN